ncbi:hypothetical protein PV08_03166 [Exophiala spinifera]|uniref:Phosphoglycerate mutase family protein n=1 Tax=Exophiala spinifera TaxID=91928 RepID=A0A0D2A1Q0_9EURO|nr:uncharacterized protein PV08_03166 [Exophiala spinifera]KIW18877.1 hypothetical protein PV08_03166 [Exophiala spinifera]
MARHFSVRLAILLQSRIDTHRMSSKPQSQAPTIYLIRHGEKPPKSPNGDDEDGLSALGLSRAQALVNVFSRESKYNIGYIIAQHPKKDGSQNRPYLTVSPLAESLKPHVDFNHEIHRDDADKVAQAALGYTGTGNVLICWEHHHLTDIASAIGVVDAPAYPDDRYDVIWTLESPYDKISSVTSEHCQGLDDQYANEA